MKKKIILLIALFTFSYFAKAQSYTPSYIEGGVILMPQFTTLLNTNDFAAGKALDYATTFGYAGGLSGSYNFNKHFGVELNVIYSVQGQKYTGDLNDYKPGKDTASYVSLVSFQAQSGYNLSTGSWPASDNPYAAQVSLTYFKIPVLFKLTSNSEKTSFFYMNAGPEFNILLSASQSLNGKAVSYSSQSPDVVYSFTAKQLYESSGIDAVLNLGAGYNLTSHFVLTAQIDFDYGLTDVENKDFEYTVSIHTPALSSTPTTEELHTYASNRSATNNATVGLRLGVAYKFGDPDKISSKLTP